MTAGQRSLCKLTLSFAVVALTVTGPVGAFRQVDTGSVEGLAALTFRDHSLYVGSGAVAIERAEAFPSRQAAWERFSTTYGQWSAWVDPRTGSVLVAEGTGIRWMDGSVDPQSAPPQAVLDQLEQRSRELVEEWHDLLGVRNENLVLAREASGRFSDDFWVVSFDLVVGGVPVDGGRLSFRIGHGNLIQIGSSRLPDPGQVSTEPRVPLGEALEALWSYLGEDRSGALDRRHPPRLLVVHRATSERPGFGGLPTFEPCLAWEIRLDLSPRPGRYAALVDAGTGDLLSFQDLVLTSRVGGGVFPVSNDGDCPTGCEQPGYPMPFAQVTPDGVTRSAGLFTWSGGSVSTDLSGPYVEMHDSCGAISETGGVTTGGDIDLGVSGGTDCAVPAGHSAGDTHSSRTGFYGINRMKEVGRAWLPGNSWLQSQLTVNVNINDYCNAYWDGSLNMFKSSAGECGNTGEILAVLDHEYGHGLDENDGGGFAMPVEAFADCVFALQLGESCVGRGFHTNGSFCSGYGDPCLTCTGIRDIDWAGHAGNAPHTPQNFVGGCGGGSYNGPCGGEDHCESYVASEALWDLVTRDLPAHPMDPNQALHLTNRFFYLSAPNAGPELYNCTGSCPSCTSDGCNAGSWFTLFRALDDADGNLANGTPHAGAIFAAFARHNLACGTVSDPANQSHDECPAVGSTVLAALAGHNSASLSWSAATGAASYDVLRNEQGCDAGWLRITTTAALGYVDSGVANGSTYFYKVLPVGSSSACEGPLSNCATVVPQPFAGVVTLGSGAYSCADLLDITVLDAGPSPPSSLAVDVSSDSETSPESVTLTETAPGSATYVGSLPTAAVPPAPGDGALSVSNGDTITVHYLDPDDGSGFPRDNQDTAVVDCVAPVISGVTVSDIYGTSALVSWATSEPADSRVDWGLSCGSPIGQNTGPASVTSHAVRVTGLDVLTQYFFTVTSADPAGNSVVDDNGGTCYSFTTTDLSPDVYVANYYGNTVQRFSPDGSFHDTILDAGDNLLEPTGVAFTHDLRLLVASGGNATILVSDLEGSSVSVFADSGDGLSFPGGIAVGPTGDVYVADCGNDSVVKFDSLGNKLSEFPSEGFCPTGLAFSPDGGLVVANFSSATLTAFDASDTYVGVLADSSDGLTYPVAPIFHPGNGTLLVTNGYSNNIIEVTLDGTLLGVFADASQGLNTPFGAAWNASGELLVANCFSTDELTRLGIDGVSLGVFADSADGLNSPFAVAVVGQLPTSSSAGRVFFASSTFGCEQSAGLKVLDSDLNTDPGIAETVDVTVSSATEPAGEIVTLVEQSTDSSQFSGQIQLSTLDGAGVVHVTPGDDLTALYHDADDGSGSPADVTDSAVVGLDCTGPVISGVHVEGITSSTARVVWSTGEPADSLVEYGTTPALGSSRFVSGLVTTHAVPLDGLLECTPYHYRVTSADTLGNSATDDNGGALYLFETYAGTLFLSEDFEAGAPGWTHSGTGDEWQVGTPTYGPPAAHGGSGVYATDLDSTYDKGGANTDVSLYGPAVDLTAAGAATLSFWHWFDIWNDAAVNATDDGAWLEASTDGGSTWQVLTPQGGYNNTLDDEAPYPGGPCWSGTTGSWQQVEADLSPLAGSTVRLRFRFFSDSDTGTARAGWYVDDLRVDTSVPCGPYPVYSSHVVVDDPLGNADGVVDPGEWVVLPLTLVNLGVETALSVVGHLSSTTPGITVENGVASFPDLAPSSPATSTPPHFRFRVEPSVLCGSAIDFDLVVSFTDPGGSPGQSLSSTRLQVGSGGSGGVATVAVFDHASTADISYFSGTNQNLHSQLKAILDGDPLGRFDSTTVTSLDPATLSGYDVLVLPDNAVPDASLAAVSGWFGAGKTIVAVDSAVCYAAFSGLLWPASAGDNGNGTYWDYSSSSAHRIALADPITADYSVGQVITAVSGDARAFASELEPGTVSLLIDNVASGMVTVAYRDVPGAGRVILLGPLSPPPTDNYELVRAAVASIGGAVCHPFSEIYLDRDRYLCEDTATVRVVDSDLNQDPGLVETAPAEISSLTEPAPELLVLSETGPDTGAFEGQIAMSLTDAAGVLQVSQGDIVTAVYHDADAGGTGPLDFTAGAGIATDCTPPVISGVHVEDITSSTARVVWTTDEPSDSLVEYGPTPALGSSRFVAGLVSSHSVLLDGLADCTVYQFRVTSVDAPGNGATDDNGGALYLFASYAGAVFLSEGFEAGAAGWTHSGTGDEWEVGTPTYGPPTAHGGSGVYATDLDSTYDKGAANSDASLYSPVVDLTGAGGAILSFWHWYDIWNDAAPNGQDDGAWLEASTNGGSTWQVLTPEAGYNNTLDAEAPYPSGPCWSGTTGSWQQVEVDLAAFAGSTVRLRFRFFSDADEGTGRAGWYVDDLRVDTSVPCGPNPVHSSHVVVDGPLGNFDGVVDPGEWVDLPLTLVNLGALTASSVVGHLSTGTSEVTVENAVASFPDLPPFGTAMSTPPHFRFRVDLSVPCGGAVDLDLVVDFVDPVGSPGQSVSSTRLYVGSGSSAPTKVAIFQDNDPWGYASNQEVLASNGIPFTIFSTADIGSANLSEFDRILISSEQPPSFYAAVSSNREWFEGWIAGGRTFEMHGASYYADWGALTMPGGWSIHYSFADDVEIVDPVHPLVNDPNPITPGELDNWGHSFIGWSDLYPANATTVVTEAVADEPVAQEWTLGAGSVLVSTLTLEWGWAGGYSPILENFLLRMPIGGECQPFSEIHLDRDQYLCEDTARVRVVDPDLNQDPNLVETAPAEISSLTEPTPEMLVLSETGPDTGAFEGVIALALTDAAGVLWVSPGDAVTATYHDNDAAGTGPLVFTAVALVATDCAPPVVSGVHVEGVTSSVARAVWTTDEPSDSLVEFGTSPVLGSSRFVPGLATAHSVLLDGLVECTVYYFRVTSTDVSGNSETDDNGGALYVFASYLGTVFLGEDFEAGAPGWTHSGTGDEWEVGTPTYGPTSAHGGGGVYATDLDSTCDKGGVNTDASLYSPDVDLTGAGGATLSFWHFYDIWNDAAVSGTDDGAWLEASTDGGSSWQVLTPAAGYNNTLDSEAPYPFGPCWSGSTSFWERVEVDLDAFAGSTLRLRFRFFSEGDEGTARAGWYVDDLRVDTAVPCGPNPVYSSHVVVDGPLGNSDGVVDPGEWIDLPLTLVNIGVETASSVVGHLSTGTPGVTVENATASFPDLPPSGSAASIPSHFRFRVDPSVSCDSAVDLDLTVDFTDSGGSPGQSHGAVRLWVGSGPGGGDCHPFSEIFLDSNVYLCEDVAVLRVVDSDLNLDPGLVETAAAEISSLTEPAPELLVLSETGPDTGAFEGEIAVSLTDAAGVLQVSHGDAVTAVYHDADAGGIGPLDFTAVAEIATDCSPPVISEVAVQDLTMSTARAVWATDEPSDSLVEFGTTSGLGFARLVPSLVTNHSVFLDGLAPCTSYFFRVTSADGSGNATTDDNGGVLYLFQTYAETLLLSAGFDAGITNWSHSGTGDEWEIGTPTYGPTSAHGGRGVYATDLDSTYDKGGVNADASLYSPGVDLTQVDGATLRFWHWYDIWTHAAPYGEDDGAWLEGSTDGGATWQVLTPTGGYDNILDEEAPHPNGPCWSGTTDGWELVEVNLSSFVGSTVRLRFRFFSDGDEGSPRAGWYVDDVSVDAHSPCPFVDLIFADRFESGDTTHWSITRP